MGGVSKSSCKLLCDSEKLRKAAVCPTKNNGELLNLTFFRSWHHLLFLDNIEKIQEKIKVLNTFENIVNGAFAPNEQILHFP